MLDGDAASYARPRRSHRQSTGAFSPDIAKEKMKVSYSQYWEPKKKLFFTLLICFTCIATSLNVRVSLNSLNTITRQLEDSMTEVSEVFQQTADALAVVEKGLGTDRRKRRDLGETEDTMANMPSIDPPQCCSMESKSMTCCSEFAEEASSMMDAYVDADEQFCDISLHMLAKLAMVLQTDLGIQVGLLDTILAFANQQGSSDAHADDVAVADAGDAAVIDAGGAAVDDAADAARDAADVHAAVAEKSEEDGTPAVAVDNAVDTSIDKAVETSVDQAAGEDDEVLPEGVDEILADALRAMTQPVTSGNSSDSGSGTGSDSGSGTGSDSGSGSGSDKRHLASIEGVGSGKESVWGGDRKLLGQSSSSVDSVGSVSNNSSGSSGGGSSSSSSSSSRIALFSGTTDTASELLGMLADRVDGPVKDDIVRAVQVGTH
jgi:hypothetical protein